MDFSDCIDNTELHLCVWYFGQRVRCCRRFHEASSLKTGILCSPTGLCIMQASQSVAMSLYLNQRENSIIILSGSLLFQEADGDCRKFSLSMVKSYKEDYETSKIDDVGIVNEKDKIRQ